MTRRTDFTKAKSYTGQKLTGMFDIAYKIDGVRVLDRENGIVTRNDKVPPGLDKFLTSQAKQKISVFGDCEIYKHGQNFHFISGNLAKHDPESDIIGPEDIYPLHFCDGNSSEQHFDSRLMIDRVQNPTPEYIQEQLIAALNLGYEGLVLRCNSRWYRVKPDYTADVKITGWFEQFDKHKRPKGILGGFTTAYGKVTAFKEEDRVKLWDNPQQYVGQMMTVKYKELYESGSFRYAVTFLHFRHDKDEEAFDTRELV